MPSDVGAELAKQEQRERGSGDPVHVVVAVDADAAPFLDSSAELSARSLHVAEEEWIMRRLLAAEKTARLSGVGVAPPDEHRCRDLRDSERADELRLCGRRAVGECPGAVVHAPAKLRRGADGTGPAKRLPQTGVDRLLAFRHKAASSGSLPTRHASATPGR